ncbi:MAG: glycosyltransferase family 4 protein [Ardenticatenales bacterium]|nr:glycosyltransferase family 4 protein [Ardenticatenales bacterium]
MSEAQPDINVAFVTPWYGADIPGGMEAETRRTAERLVHAGISAHILTTTIRDFFADWSKNHHKTTRETINGVPVRRFPVRRRDRAAFDAVNWRLMQNLPITPRQEQTYIRQMINCPDLYDHIRTAPASTLFLFIPYMFATTYYGAQVWPRRSLVIPCLHDESYARLSLYRQVFPHVRGLILHTEAELALADALYPRDEGQLRVVLGEGVDTDWQGDEDRFRQKYGIRGDFVLVAGRKDAGKNTPLLLDYWRRYVHQRRPSLRLLFIGPGDITIPLDLADSVVDLGFVPRQDKYDAHAASLLLCQPSTNESFSLVLMESWLAQRPALVHADCAVTVEQCQKANAGLYFADYDEFAATLDYFQAQPQTARRMGEQGRRYVLANFHWDVVVARYRALLARVARGA